MPVLWQGSGSKEPKEKILQPAVCKEDAKKKVCGQNT